MLYSAAGNSGDMLWYKYGIYAWDFEVGSTFQPPFEAETPTGPAPTRRPWSSPTASSRCCGSPATTTPTRCRPTSEVKVTSSATEGKVNVEFTTSEPASVFYTTDGTVPNLRVDDVRRRRPARGRRAPQVDEGAEVRWITVDSRGNVERNFVPGREGNYRTWIAEVGYEAPLPASSTSPDARPRRRSVPARPASPPRSR